MRIFQAYCILIFAIAAAALLLLPADAASSARHCRFSAIFNFGDSNSDTGGSSSTFVKLNPPYAETLGLPYLSAYLDSIGSNFTHGANFATFGSTIRLNTTMLQNGASPVSLDTQYFQFSEFLTRSQLVRNQGGVFNYLLPDEEAFSRALYTVDIGINDLTAGFKENLSTDQIKAYVHDVLHQLSKRIEDVYKKGGRTFWIQNTGPLGCLPYTLVRFPVAASEIDEHGCSKPHNEVSQFFNLKLMRMVDELRILLPSAAITYVDVYDVKYTLIRDAKKLGFDDPFLACCGGGGKYNYARSQIRRCGTKEAKTCEKPKSRINWDGLHYTEAANKWVFDRIVNGSFSDPPVALSLACRHNRH